MKILFLQTLILASILLLNACGFRETSAVNNDILKNSENASVDKEKVLSLCDVGNNPAEFDGKVISLKTRIAFGTENTVISDGKCAHRAVVTFKDEKAITPIDKMRKDGWRRQVTVFNADLEIKAKFINKPFTGCCTETPFQFEVIETMQASPVISN